MKSLIDIACLAAVGFSVFLIAFAFSPGHTNLDTIKMLDQAHTGEFNNWHSPLVTGVWYLMGGQPWLIQASLYTTLIAFACFTYQLFIQASLRHRIACLLTILICFTPPVLSGLGTVCKDTWAATLFLGIIVLSIIYQQRSNILLLVLRNISLVVASAIRPEFIIIAGFFLLLEALYVTAFWRVFTNGFAVLALFFVLGFSVTHLEHSKDNHPEQQLFLGDLIYLSIAKNTVLVPEPFLAGSTLDTMRKNYRDSRIDGNLFDGPKSEMMEFSSDPAAVHDLQSRWIAAVIRFPLAALDHRFQILKAYFWEASYFQTGIDTNDYDLHAYHPNEDRLAVDYLRAFTRSPLQRHFFSFFGSVILIVMIVRQASVTLFDRYLVIGLTTGCFYHILVAVLGMGPMWRYGYAGEVVFWIALYIAAARMIEGFLKSRMPIPS